MKTSTTRSFQHVLAALLDSEEAFPQEHLYRFSDIEPAQLSALLEVWEEIPPERKREMLHRMETMLEEDTLLSFDTLAAALLRDADSEVRSAAIRLLAECERAALIPIFVEILIHDEEPGPRAAAATSLGLFVLNGELDKISAEALRDVEDALLHAAKSSDSEEVRRRALESLGFSSRPEVPALIESAYWRENPLWTASALFAMARSSDDRWSEEVLRMLSSPERDVRLAAVHAAGELSLSEARQPLLDILQNEADAKIFEAAIWSLSQIGGEDVREYLEAALDLAEEDEQIEFMEDALANLDFTEDIQQFEMMSYDPEDPPEEA